MYISEYVRTCIGPCPNGQHHARPPSLAERGALRRVPATLAAQFAQLAEKRIHVALTQNVAMAVAVAVAILIASSAFRPAALRPEL